MKDLKIHTLFSPYREGSKAYARSFIDAFGQAPITEADYIFAAGGDGTTYYALNQALSARRQRVIGATRPGGSDSTGFITDHGIHQPGDLLDRIATSEFVDMAPIEAEIIFANGQSCVTRVFNDVSALRASNQAAFMEFQSFTPRGETGAQDKRYDLIGCGILFASALGSTGLNHSHGGPVLEMEDPRMIVTGMGVNARHGFKPLIMPPETYFRVDFANAAKVPGRVVRIDHDRGSVEQAEDGSRVVALEVGRRPDMAVPLARPQVPGPARQN